MIRRATLADLSAIVDIYNQAVADRFATADTTPVTVEQRTAMVRGARRGVSNLRPGIRGIRPRLVFAQHLSIGPCRRARNG